MSFKFPEFLSIDLIQSIFESNFDENIKVTNFNCEAATKPGDNYASDMTQINVDYEFNGMIMQKSIILKVLPANEVQKKVMTKCRAFPREIHTYSKLLVEIDKLLISVGDNTKFSPKCLYTATDPVMMLIFEDMRDKNYVVLPRFHQLSFDEALPLMVKLGKLHAASAVLYDRDPSIMEPYLEGLISTNPDRKDFLIHYKNCIRALAKVAKNEWGKEWNEITRKLEVFETKVISKGCDLFSRKSGDFAVFNQNDLWVRNLFFKKDKFNNIDDVLLIDYQISYFGSLGIDLSYLFYGTIQEEVRILRSKELLKIYHQNFKATLEALKYDKRIPTLQDIHVEFLKSSFNGLLATTSMTPILMMKDSSKMNLLLVNSEEGENFRYSLFNTEKYKDFIQKLLIEFDELGFLD